MTTLDNDIRKSGHYSEVDVVDTVIAVGRVSNLMSGVLQDLFPGWAHSFTSCQLALLVKDEHRVLVKGYGLIRPRKRVVRIN